MPIFDPFHRTRSLNCDRPAKAGQTQGHAIEQYQSGRWIRPRPRYVGEQRRVRIRYRSESSKETKREFDPYVVVRREGYWYVVGHDHLRGATRLFRLDRVLEAELLGATFRRPPGFDAPEDVLDALAAMPHDRWSVEVLLETTPEEAREQTPAMGVILEEAEGGVLMRSSTSDLGWMARVLARLSFPFVVKKLPELREALRRHAAELATRAERTA